MGSSSAPEHRRQLVAAVALILAVAAAVAPLAEARRKTVRLRVYMHDIVGGAGQTSVVVVKGPGPANPSMSPGNNFGDTVIIDDVVTEGPSLASREVGRAQGTYMLASMARPVFIVDITLVLTDGPYNGSTIVVAGRDDTSEEIRELAVVGGSGMLRRASGHVLWRTAKVESKLHAVLELDVHASVPAAAVAPSGSGSGSHGHPLLVTSASE
ncbi:dirigent protein 1-like [Oryza glaberrima]|uniref:dirigent protein 1-like n=1 Tax=Oryza glaberrima TaxID=4538 RepID=UPI00224C0EB7|nr:dirigent protein 1-like [Oryza glaberrima]